MPRPKIIRGSIEFRLAQTKKDGAEEQRMIEDWIDSVFQYRIYNGNTELIIKAIDLDVGIKRKNPMKFTPETTPKDDK